LPTPDALPAERGETVRPPLWHTLLLVTLLLLVAAAGTLSGLGREAPRAPESRVIAGYLPMVVVNAFLALYVARLGRRRNALGELVGQRWTTARQALVDAMLALLAAAIILLSEYAWAAAFGAPNRAWANALLPRTALERAAWVVVAASVGTSEELVYRGYLQRELGALTSSRALGLVTQALLFAIAHGEQGAGTVARSFLYGLGFGALARVRRSVLPGIMAHVGLDLAAGFVRG